jgi:hypothetical protein
MVSLLHEGVTELVRHHPAFVADLLGGLLHAEVPRFTEAQLVDTTSNIVIPIERMADAVVLLVNERGPVLG